MAMSVAYVSIYPTYIGAKMARGVAYLGVLNVDPYKMQTYLGVLNVGPSVPRW